MRSGTAESLTALRAGPSVAIEASPLPFPGIKIRNLAAPGVVVVVPWNNVRHVIVDENMAAMPKAEVAAKQAAAKA